ncbi:tRNA lysidine(34) synthetase TilS [Micromonospora peucetia]|uniref:tRNA(Ile)-lysidine synthase n=1 Tax=Micromonospora peucetia TaxID=47871 RepID=A0A1C6V2C8_9ACTN|nr:tRNA lysidine(34) synthetase TilS [Micromonospora peucetia]MCX4389053.1 tRNA lysidine(34) synthetase TilS [Micromonospora peucetia]WSA35259.1 tRNA lysidine(34) synthetase TilS [Micromonospora peucetia]SCL60482.1 tRNA(Ile)-lysidine synthase [Micromonospora peucetia]
MAALAPPVAAIRVAVRRALIDLPPGGPVLVACSGGADSLALAAATAFVAPRLGRAAGLVTVDHGLQEGSAQRAAAVVRWAREVGLAPVESVRVEVAGRPGGPEAAAREARYRALADVAARLGAAALLTGHTRDDQAETVLLALARGAGPRGLAGMPVRRDLDGVPLLRPLLEVGREQTRTACAVLGLSPWEDPHNADPSYARARVRADVLPALVRALGPGVLDNLARTARLVAADNAVLDELAGAALADVRHPDGGLAVRALADLPPAVRGRVLHAWARELGAPPAALSHRHVTALDALVTGWRGQGPAHLPGGLRVLRRDGRLAAIDFR